MRGFQVVPTSPYGYAVVCEAQPTFEVMFWTERDAIVYADKANVGKTHEQCLEAVAKAQEARRKRNEATRARNQAMRDLGMKRVKGNLGGTYWE